MTPLARLLGSKGTIFGEFQNSDRPSLLTRAAFACGRDGLLTNAPCVFISGAHRGSGVCKKNAREFVVCPKKVSRSAHTRFVSSGGPPPLPPQFQCCGCAKGGVLVLQNKRPLLFSAAVLSVVPGNRPGARPPFQTNIEIGGGGGAAAFREMPARVPRTPRLNAIGCVAICGSSVRLLFALKGGLSIFQKQFPGSQLSTAEAHCLGW